MNNIKTAAPVEQANEMETAYYFCLDVRNAYLRIDELREYSDNEPSCQCLIQRCQEQMLTYRNHAVTRLQQLKETGSTFTAPFESKLTQLNADIANATGM